MSEDYDDGRVTCTADAVRLHMYYFPFGTKTIPYGDIRGVRKVDIGTFTGRGRIWGTANISYWANLDPSRPRKTTGLVLDLGKRVSPFVTPDDTDRAEAVIRERAHLGPADGGSSPGPVI
jgi:hypothetical protein